MRCQLVVKSDCFFTTDNRHALVTSLHSVSCLSGYFDKTSPFVDGRFIILVLNSLGFVLVVLIALLHLPKTH